MSVSATMSFGCAAFQVSLKLFRRMGEVSEANPSIDGAVATMHKGSPSLAAGTRQMSLSEPEPTDTMPPASPQSAVTSSTFTSLAYLKSGYTSFFSSNPAAAMTSQTPSAAASVLTSATSSSLSGNPLSRRNRPVSRMYPRPISTRSSSARCSRPQGQFLSPDMIILMFIAGLISFCAVIRCIRNCVPAPAGRRMYENYLKIFYIGGRFCTARSNYTSF